MELGRRRRRLRRVAEIEVRVLVVAQGCHIVGPWPQMAVCRKKCFPVDVAPGNRCHIVDQIADNRMDASHESVRIGGRENLPLDEGTKHRHTDETVTGKLGERQGAVVDAVGEYISRPSQRVTGGGGGGVIEDTVSSAQ